MNRAAVVIRSSQGSGDKISLQMQREECIERAEEIADDVDVIDLGIHTGFSAHVKPDAEERIDNNEEILRLFEGLRNGDYDYVVAYNPSRIARDEYLFEIIRASIVGGAEFEFLEESVNIDDMTFGITHVVEAFVKRREFRQSARAKAIRDDKGLPDGRPPKGMMYNGDATEHVPDPEEFPTVLEVLSHRRNGASYRDIVDATGVPKSSISGIIKREDYYIEAAEEHGYELPSIDDN